MNTGKLADTSEEVWRVSEYTHVQGSLTHKYIHLLNSEVATYSPFSPV